jgi:hypothetical protein
MNQFFDQDFINKVMANFHLKIYDYSASAEQVARKKSFKETFNNFYKEKI